MKLIDADEIVYEETLRCIGRTGNTSSYYHDYHAWAGDIDKMPTVEAIPIEYILTTIRKWNLDGYAESAEALEILIMNWNGDKGGK